MRRRDRGPAPWGLIGMLGLALAVEAGLARRGDAVRTADAQCWRATAALLKRHAAEADVLCFGDSLVKNGVYTRVLERLTGRPSYNLAVNRGPAPVTYHLLRRALAAGARPSAVLVDAASFTLDQGPRTTAPPGEYPFAELLAVSESAELAWSSRDPDLFVRLALKKVLPSYGRRFSVREDLLAALDGRETGARVNNRALARNLAVNGGAQVNADWVAPVTGPEPPPGDGPEQPLPVDPVNRLYLERTFALLRRHRIPAVWLLPPVHPREHALRRAYGLDAGMTRFVAAVRARHPEVIVVDGRDTGFDGSMYLDMSHLNARGAVAYTAAVAEVLNGLLSGPAPRDGWVRLPGPRPAPADGPLETMDRSRAIVRSAGGPVVR